MSKLTYICLRNEQTNTSLVERLLAISAKILPDNIAARPTHIIDNKGILAAIYNPHPSVKILGENICIGNPFGVDAWQVPGSQHPDGTFAIFRADQDVCQVLTDVVATRTVWYFQDDEKFIASTSQRALINLLGSFEFNQDIIPWMLATGSIGPLGGWDKRIKRLEPDSILTLDRHTWELTRSTPEIVFSTVDAPEANHLQKLKTALEHSFSNLKLDFSHWVLLLSGGYDSRSILCLLKEKTGLRTVTWGVKSAQADPSSDAYIANQLADQFNLQHHYFETDFTGGESPDIIFDRYLVNGDGEIDHFSGYVDGFKVWKTLYEARLDGIIRGDEGFGWVEISNSALDVRLSLGIPLWSDYSNLKSLEEFGLPEQKVPAWMRQKDGETFPAWRDRLYHQFRIPVVLGALSDLKLAYVEIINPLLSREIIQIVRRLPDSLRTDKTLYKKIARAISPDIPYASSTSLAEKIDLLNDQQVLDFLKEELNPDGASIFPKAFLRYIIDNISLEKSPSPGASARKSGIKKLIKALLPKGLRGKLKNAIAHPELNFNMLAFRAFMINRMYHNLVKDIEELAR
jgi:hypothetical protein